MRQTVARKRIDQSLTKGEWEHVKGITLIGDAAHLTPPDGDGANWALYDGAALAKPIAANRNDIEAALVAFEAEMLPRSARSSIESHQSFERTFGYNAPDDLRAMIISEGW